VTILTTVFIGIEPASMSRSQMSSSFEIEVANGAPLRFRGGVETGAPQQQEPHAGGYLYLIG
jgi:hypothetical protein